MSYTYDNRNRLAQVNNSGGSADATYTYDASGNAATLKYRNNIQSTYSYNARNQLTLLVAGLNGGSGTASFKYDDSSWGGRRIAGSGQRRRLNETIGAVVVNRTVDYDYDGLNRLTVENIQTVAPYGTITYDANPGYASDPTGRGYDRVGNRRSRTVTSASTPALTAQGVLDYASQTVDANDLIGADNNGSRPDPVQDFNGNTVSYGTYAYGYDLENRLIGRTGGTALTLVYDGDGNRVRKKEGTAGPETWYLLDDRNPTGYAQIIEERKSTGGAPSLTVAPTAAYVYGLDLVNQNRSGTIHYFGYDGLGSVRYLTANSGDGITDTYTCDAFGIQIATTSTGGATPNNYRFAGEYLDPDLGLYNLRARDFHPDTGRLWTRDSFEGSQTDPLSLHKYLYCHDNPLNRIDPSGHEDIIATVGNLALQGYVRTATFVATRPILARTVGLVAGLFIASELDLNALQGLPQFQGLSAFQTAEVKFLDALKRGPVYERLTQQLKGLLSNKAGHAFEDFLKRTVFRNAVALDQRVSQATKHEVDFLLDNAIVEAKNTPRIDADQLSALAEYAKKEQKDLWYVFLQKPGRAVIDAVKNVGGKVAWFLDESD